MIFLKRKYSEVGTMRYSIQKANWIVDALLFTGLCITAIIDLTGLALHQWLGLAVGILAGYHFFSHWIWVKSVTQRWFGRTSGQARRFYIIDAGLLIGFSLILLSGLAISTWFDLTLSNYAAWRSLHVMATLITLVLAVIKIGAHWRWVVKIGQRMVNTFSGMTESKPAQQPKALPAKQTNMGRRDFLKLMSIVSMAALVASFSALDDSTSAKKTSTGQNDLSQGDSEITGDASSNGSGFSASTCYASCPRGCSYPGHCHRYVDANQNNRCDLGECI
jgi:hypothetical protein